ncbi:MFS transporter [Curtobacterium sp. PhB136]|uniref:MFS transporter n=1 Tax=Curtobacterium sp. PhB136 TaxID=2485181 RepID=UPI00140546F8|nr:MFS transporter [Curtobacterium sp. PhB136]
MYAAALAVVLLGSTAPSPLYAVYQQEWHFTSALLTVVFAVYAIALLGALLVFGRLSDHIGRRPITIAALLITIASMITFLTAHGVTGILIARLLQGLGAGAATAAATSALLDVEAPGSGRAALASTIVPGLAMATGSLGAAALVQYGPAPTHLIWAVLIVLLTAATIGVLCLPESTERRPGALRSLRPTVSVPAPARSAFFAAVPGFVAVWALSAFYLALGPKLSATMTNSGNTVLDTVIVALLTGTGSLASIPLRAAPVAVLSRLGLGILLTGTATALLSICLSAPVLLFIGSGIAGVGWGLAYLGLYRALVRLAYARSRAGMVSSIYVVAYLAVGIPAVAAGVSTTLAGLLPTAIAYLILIMILSAIAFAVALRTRPILPSAAPNGAPAAPR